MKQTSRFRLYEKYPDEYVATARVSGRPLAHAPSLRKLYALLKHKDFSLTDAVIEKIPPQNTVVIY